MSRPLQGASGATTGGRLLARNSALNLLGWGLPVVLAVLTLPALIHGFGEARFGVLSLAWTVVGYFALFDLGLGRALTHAAAERIGSGREAELPSLVRTAVAVMLPVGVAAGLAGMAASGWLVRGVLRVPAALQGEAVAAFRLLALGIPFLVLTAGLRGVLEARQWFGALTALRAPLALLTFLAPLAVLPFTTSLVPAVALLVAGRGALCVAHALVVRRAVPGVLRSGRVDGAMARGMMGYGGWVTATNLVSPLMNTLDRFVVGAVVGVATVAHYATAQEVATKLWLVTAAVLPVFFPALAATWRAEPGRAALLYERVVRALVALVFPAALLLVALAPEGLALWVGAAFAAETARPLQWLAIAVYVNTLAQAAFTMVQAAGRARFTALLQVAELPAFALGLWWVLPRWGIEGAAVVWGLRVAVDTAALLVAARRYRAAGHDGSAVAWRWLGGTVPALVVLSLVEGTSARIGAAVVVLLCFSVVAIRWLVSGPEREFLRRSLSGRGRRAA